MSETPWTPGPWIAVRSRLDGREWNVKSSARNLAPYHWLPRLIVGLYPLNAVGDKKEVNAHAGSGSSDAGCCPVAIEENAANARLISAAPELAAALDIIIRPHLFSELDIIRAHERARAALAKAKGETP